MFWYFVKMLFSYGAWLDLGKKTNDLSTVLSRSQTREGLVSRKGCVSSERVFSSMLILGQNRVDLKDIERSVEQLFFV